ncbi:unnamed protein product [Auanema sp. JU1783]|nr:unnamed protein product [Auanema sp. JU1783]
MREKTQCCGRNWCVSDPCGIACAIVTWLLLIYGQVVISIVMLSAWEKYTFHTAINFLLFQIFFVLAFVSHIKTMLTNPGAIPKGNATDEHIERLQAAEEMRVLYKCQKCCSIKPEKAHHCSVCERCIKRMDHHCPWVNNCVGEGNQKFFVLFTLYIALLSMHALYWGIWQLILCVGNEWNECSAIGPPGTTLLLIFLLFESILFSIFTLVMFGTQISAICSDESTIDAMKNPKVEKIKGKSWKNLQYVFGGPCSMRWLNPFVNPYYSKPAFEYSV